MSSSHLHDYLAAQFSGLAARHVVTRGEPLCLAVSGGPDSMALAQLCVDVARPHHPLHLVTVDHGLRAEAADEAALVAKWAAEKSLPHAVLTWTPDGNEGANNNLHEQARMARYALMAQWCAARGIRHILTGHHQDDQAETLLMRLGRGSGVDGLSAMRGKQELMTAGLAPVTLLRPLLGVPKQALEQFARRAKLPTVDDPSNRADRFMRARHRQFLAGAEAAALGLTAARLADTARVMQRAADALDMATQAVLDEAVVAAPLGYMQVALAPLMTAADDIRFRALRVLLQAMNPGSFPVEEAQLLRLWAWVIGPADDAPRYTIRGLLLEKSGVGAAQNILIMREPRAIAGPRQIVGKQPFLWDGRFDIRPAPDAAGQWIIAAGALGLSRVRDGVAPSDAALIASCPPMARGSVPVCVAGDLTENPADSEIIGLQKAGFAPRLAVKSPLMLPDMASNQPKTG